MVTESHSEELFVPLDTVAEKLKSVGVLSFQGEVIMRDLQNVGVVKGIDGAFVRPGEGTDAVVSELRTLVTLLSRQNENLLGERAKLAETIRVLKGERWREYLRFDMPSDEIDTDILRAMEGVFGDPDSSLAEEFKTYVADLLAKKAIEPVPDMDFGVGLMQFTTEVTEKVVDRVVDVAGSDTPEGQKLRLQIIESIKEGFMTGDIDDSFVYELLQNLGVRVLSEDILKEFFRLRTLSLSSVEEQELKRAIVYGFTLWKKDKSTSLQPEMDLTS